MFEAFWRRKFCPIKQNCIFDKRDIWKWRYFSPKYTTLLQKLPWTQQIITNKYFSKKEVILFSVAKRKNDLLCWFKNLCSLLIIYMSQTKYTDLQMFKQKQIIYFKQISWWIFGNFVHKFLTSAQIFGSRKSPKNCCSIKNYRLNFVWWFIQD